MNLLAPPQQVHGLKPDCEFTLPPLDGTLTVPEIFDFHYKNNPNHPVFVYADNSGTVVNLAYSDVVPATHRAALHIAKIAGLDLNSDPTACPPIAIVATSGAFNRTMFDTFCELLLQIRSRTSPAW